MFFSQERMAEIIPTPTGVVIRGKAAFGETFERRFDLVVLSIGMSPPEDSKLIANLLKITLDKDQFFLEAHVGSAL